MVDMIITDSPLLNSLVYGDTTETFKSLVIEEYWKRPTFDIYLNRVKEYNPAGRSQKLEEAIEIDRITTRRVEEIKEFDLMVDGEKASTEKIMDAVLIKYKELAKY
jgi:hypothetical protein